jgi:hypothetical protein
MQLVNMVQGIAPKPANYPVVKLNAANGILAIGGIQVDLSPREFALMYVMFNRIKQNHVPASWPDLEDDFTELLGKSVPTTVNWLHSFTEMGTPDPDDFRKWASSARTKLRKVVPDLEMADMLLPPLRKQVTTYPSAKISISDVSRRQKPHTSSRF